MTLALDAAVDLSTWSVRLTASGGVPPYTVTASPGGGRDDYPVRSVWSGSTPTRVAVDGSAPLNVPIMYVVTDASGAQAQSGAVVVDSDVPILSDSSDPGRALPVTVAGQTPSSWEARSVWWPVLGRPDPFVSVAPMLYRSGELTLRVETRAAARALLDLLRPGWPFVLRSTCPDAVDDVIGLPTLVDEDLIITDAPAGPRSWRVRYQAVSRELGPYAGDPGRTYATVASAHASYADVVAAFPTYTALRLGDGTAGLGPDLIVNGGFDAALSSWGLAWSDAGSWNAGAGVATFTADGATDGRAVMSNAGIDNDAIPAGRSRIRVTGRVRVTAPAASVRLDLVVNDAGNAAGYFQPGAVAVPTTLPRSAAWSTFAAVITVPADRPFDVATLYLRADTVTVGTVVEWDDVTARWVDP